jgi:hypothetical protein
MATLTDLRGFLARPAVRSAAAASCVAVIVGLSLLLFRQLSTPDPRTIVRIPPGYDLACESCGHAWRVAAVDWRRGFEGQEPSPTLELPCPECGKRTGRLLDPCPWCSRPLPRNRESPNCPSCGKDPNKWTAH